ncbi:MAG: L-threonylcarbamoyladenylate synthase [Thermoanaerobaculia bacterium]
MTPAEVLASGGVLAIPTESSYGLGVDPRSAEGVEAIYRMKGRERGKALPVVAGDVAQLLAIGVEPDSLALAWGAARWPRALTVVLPLVAPIAASAGERTIAARVPDHAGLRALLLELGTPLTATSANASGEPPLLDPAAVQHWLAGAHESFLIVDGGALPGGLPSTLVEISNGNVTILRKGRDAAD